jgi:DMSO/TMAO reductase YedYZ heme-binding membrane subunit
MSFSLHGPGLWYVTRATGLVTLLLLTASVLLGVLTAGRFASDKWPRFLTVGLHRNVSVLILVFLALHVGTTVIDTYTSIPVISAFIPFSTSYKTGWLALGAVACDLLIALVVTSLVRNRLGHKAWRRIHWAAYLCWPVAVTHGLGAGTDRTTIWVFALTVVCVAIVAAVATWRFVSSARAGAR